ncbi:mitochondrial 39-S ribosomal protein L47 (MRP-L47)-domain-containing protein [Jimgerdemannia flammicorona]|uniref:Large ribosomal subunit protein uL29m n=1 Tax=Jimgerdemannia flammicorona TaxID=994334 RepID=A0A433CE19_9FUNG|nr:mitochondrial 39-S ribosomal protein L47 (MRP-L47)-domain-containing protein [Jimgerdemannia flammicorona]
MSVFQRSFTILTTRLPQFAMRPRSSNNLLQFFEAGKALPTTKYTGRGWRASELRLKSFDDLHKLWYVLLKERNVLATQKEEKKLLKINSANFVNRARIRKCQKSMARIKFVLMERHIAFEKARAELKKMVDEPTESAESAESAESVESADSVESAESAESAESVDSVESVESAKSTEPTEPTKSTS